MYGEAPCYAVQSNLFFKPQAQKQTSFKLCDLNQKSPEDFLKAFQRIPDNTTYLDLETNDLYLRMDETIEAVSNLSAWLTSLDLSFNCLGGQETGDKLPQLFAAIQPNIHFVNLTGNYLGRKPVSQLELAFKSLHGKTASLNLSCNDFDQQATKDLIQIVQALPLNLKKLNLAGNDLGGKSLNDLKEFFLAFSEHKQLQHLDLQDNQFDCEQIAVIKKCLPNVTGLYFDDADFENTTLSEFNIGKALPDASQYGNYI